MESVDSIAKTVKASRNSVSIVGMEKVLK